MGRIVLTILGIAALGVGAVLIAQRIASPAGEKAQANQRMLTHAYRPKLQECRVLEDNQLPESLPRPGVGEDLVYVGVTILYPGVDRVPEPLAHRFIGVNGQHQALDPADATYEEGEEGTYLTLIFKTDNSFRFGRLVRNEETLFERIDLE